MTDGDQDEKAALTGRLAARLAAADRARWLAAAAALTPVPGGVGPVTTMLLMRHAVRAARELGRP